ncbi:MAG: addiction module protein [Fimbriimonadaceae bacterium]|nr:addiction module protein [Fimbriimonadaceae bacterium]
MIDITTLTRAQQEQLYDQLRVALGLDDEAAGGIPEWHRQILEERLAELERDDDQGEPADEVFAELRAGRRDRY